MNKDHTRIELVEGGDVFKQGDHVSLSFTPRDYKGGVVDLSGKKITVAIIGKKGIIFEADAAFDATSQVIRITINQTLDYGDFRIEFTVTDPANTAYRRKFPSGQYDGRIRITPSADNMDFAGVQMTTVTQLRQEQTSLQTEYEKKINPKIAAVEVKAADLAKRVEDGIGAFTEDTEVLDARLGEVNLGAFNRKLTAQLAEKVDQLSLRNAQKPLDLPSYDGKNQGCHPKVLYFAVPWNGFKWWMAYTPFANSNDMEENPAILASNDGVKWVVPVGLTNPIATAPSYERFYSDTHLVMRNNVLECWYRQVYRDTIPIQEMIWRKTSTDGINWSAAELMKQVDSPDIKEMLSPAIIWDASINKYRIWVINQNSSNPKGVIKYYESATGKDWAFIRNLTMPATTDYIWHLDVEKTDVGYEFLISTNSPKFILYHATSVDNMTLSNFKLLIKPGRLGSFDEDTIYRSSLTKINGTYYVFYSAMNSARKWGIGLTVSQKINDISSILGFSANSTMMSKDPLISDEFGSVLINGSISKLGNSGYVKENEIKMSATNSGNFTSIILKPVRITVDGVSTWGFEILRGDNNNRANLGVHTLDATNLNLIGSLKAANVYASNITGVKNLRFTDTTRGQVTLEQGDGTTKPDVLLFNDNGAAKKINSVNYFPTTSRPSSPYNGYQYFDTTLGKLVIRHDYGWRDAMGNTVP